MNVNHYIGFALFLWFDCINFGSNCHLELKHIIYTNFINSLFNYQSYLDITNTQIIMLFQILFKYYHRLNKYRCETSLWNCVPRHLVFNWVRTCIMIKERSQYKFNTDRNCLLLSIIHWLYLGIKIWKSQFNFVCGNCQCN